MKRAGEVISALFDEGLMKKAKSYSAFFSCWQNMTEKNGIAAAADHSWVKNLERGIVWVEVDHPGWKQILQTKESKLLADFRYRFPDMDISGLSISLCKPGARPEITDNDPAAETTPSKKRPAAEPPANTAEFQPQGSAHREYGYDAIKDEAFKEILMRLERTIAEKNAVRSE